MLPYILCTEITTSARATILENGGSIEVLREEHPHIELITVKNGKIEFEEDNTYTSCSLHPDRAEGICWLEEDGADRTIYRWNGTLPSDPELEWEEL